MYFFLKISKRLGVIFSEMIFTHGFVHCDPHPGNVLINPKKSGSKNNPAEFEIVLIDHGLYQVMWSRFGILKFFLSLLLI